MKRKDLKGRKFGKLTVLHEAGPEERRRYDTFWVCACECGGKITAGTQALQHGQVRSCGCLASAKRHEKELNKHIREGEVVKIVLNNGAEAIVDAEDYEKIKDITWHYHHGYACAYHEGHYVTMHQMILGQKYIDHIDRDRLNNRKTNLRPATPQQNCRNRRIRSDNQSGYKGVYYGTSAWIATIGNVYLGSFKTPEEAARAYDKRAIQLQKEFACLNFPEDHPEHPNRCPARRIP